MLFPLNISKPFPPKSNHEFKAFKMFKHFDPIKERVGLSSNPKISDSEVNPYRFHPNPQRPARVHR